jgi:hypothetical protein
MLQIGPPLVTLCPFSTMFPQQHKANSRYRSAWSAVVSFALVVVYIAGAVQNSTVHEIIHAEAVELHSDLNERDACHQAVYHHSNEDCGHKLHISSSDKCSMCHLVFYSEQVIPGNIPALIKEAGEPELPSYYSFVRGIDTSGLSARAPPIA